MSLLTTFGVMAYTLLIFTAAPACGRSMNQMTMNEIPSRIYKTNIDKRFDPSCKGIFDPELYKKLDAVCQDCYYLYYDEQLTTRCRYGVFKSVGCTMLAGITDTKVLLYR